MFLKDGIELLPILHYLFALYFLFLFLPQYLFKSTYETLPDLLFSRYAKMVLLLIVSGYFLVITKLFEVLSLSFMFLLIFSYHSLKKGGHTSTALFLKKVFDLLDGLAKTPPKLLVKKWRILFRIRINDLKSKLSIEGVLEITALLVIVSVAAYLRFYDAFIHAAPPMADSYVTLAWMKYINGRYLFHDGIYPQGFHIYLATLLKFAAVDALYVLRLTGPLNSILLMLGLYVVTRKLTGNGVGALTAAWLYGIFLVNAPLLNVERQAATNSQEFAFIFILPAVFFLLRYLMNMNREDLISGLICTAITGLVHSLAFGLLGLLIGIAVLSSMLTLKNSWKAIVRVCTGAIVTVILSLVPLLIGFALGKNFHSSSAEYLVDRKGGLYTYHFLTNMDYVGLASLVVMFLFLLTRKLSRKERFVAVFTVFSGSFVFLLYFGGAAWTQSTVIASRSEEFWIILLPFCIGSSLSFSLKGFKREKIQYGLFLGFLSLSFFFVSLQPIIPYKMEHGENITQYLRINEKYLPKTWMIVSQDEGYSLSLGEGYHMHIGDFLARYKADDETLTFKKTGNKDENTPSHIFVFQEKTVFKVSESNSIYELLKQEYLKREREYKELKNWMDLHKQAGNKVSVFFQNKNIIIYELEVKRKVKNRKSQVWER